MPQKEIDLAMRYFGWQETTLINYEGRYCLLVIT